jgi:hypothetical protein
LLRGARVSKVTSLDLVGRVFRRDRPNELWVTDITEHPTREGKIYCCVVLDTFSRKVVGWSIDSIQTASLVLNALGMATQRRPERVGLVIHSDRGVQFSLGRWPRGDLRPDKRVPTPIGGAPGGAASGTAPVSSAGSTPDRIQTCGRGVSTGPDTSCSFALAIAEVVETYYKANCVVLASASAFSDVTAKTYTANCDITGGDSEAECDTRQTPA